MVHQFFIYNGVFVVGYYNEFTVVQRQIICQLFWNTIESIIIVLTLSTNDYDIECLINFKVHIDYIESLFYNRRINWLLDTHSQEGKIEGSFPKSKKSR